MYDTTFLQKLAGRNVCECLFAHPSYKVPLLNKIINHAYCKGNQARSLIVFPTISLTNMHKLQSWSPGYSMDTCQNKFSTQISLISPFHTHTERWLRN